VKSLEHKKEILKRNTSSNSRPLLSYSVLSIHLDITSKDNAGRETLTLLDQFLQLDCEVHHAPRRRVQECLHFGIQCEVVKRSICQQTLLGPKLNWISTAEDVSVVI
jgi:hypothetical protein